MGLHGLTDDFGIVLRVCSQGGDGPVDLA
jgi:hypothetical protein